MMGEFRLHVHSRRKVSKFHEQTQPAMNVGFLMGAIRYCSMYHTPMRYLLLLSEFVMHVFIISFHFLLPYLSIAFFFLLLSTAEHLFCGTQLRLELIRYNEASDSTS